MLDACQQAFATRAIFHCPQAVLARWVAISTTIQTQAGPELGSR